MNLQYNYPEILAWLEQKGKQDYGDKFHFKQQDTLNITKLVAYFLKDETKTNEYGIDLTKGILLSGPVGCGKTTLMTLMKYVTKQNNRFYLKTCRDISFEFIKEGYEIIHRYSRGSYSQTEYKNYCFDDLGVEQNLKYYGNECNVMAEITLSRYDLFIARKVQTHLTTNLSASEIETAYGNRIRSRLRGMLNLIAFDRSTADKR
ncbi:AAA domain-containing protein [Flavobacterium sp. NST-5]|uniref:AAA domain-containing protein n=1 Tax=Flavobacterium ichthyis TaxID=2698827 RepID=A0ABW9ZAK6_9FLAO|nr:AAA family ATPase [Flavobacterium ichthyis]NBL65948.1 AAA domain-containing protein [Flavobacterium ichthyis]